MSRREGSPELNCPCLSPRIAHPTEWENLLLDYVREHPGVKVIDRLDSIRNLQNRGTMLNSLCGEGILVKVSTHWSARACALSQAL